MHSFVAQIILIRKLGMHVIRNKCYMEVSSTTAGVKKQSLQTGWFLDWVAHEFHKQMENFLNGNVTLVTYIKWCPENHLHLPWQWHGTRLLTEGHEKTMWPGKDVYIPGVPKMFKRYKNYSCKYDPSFRENTLSTVILNKNTVK